MTVWIDENFSPRIAKALNELVEIDVKYLPDEFGKGAKDSEWIPKVANDIVISQDYKMRIVKLERDLIEKYALGMFLIKPPSHKGLLYWQQVKLLINRWENIIKLIETTERPFIYKIPIKGSKFEKL